MNSVEQGRTVVFVDLRNKGQRLDGHVLGTELVQDAATYFWIFVLETKTVHVGVTDSLYEEGGDLYFSEVDMTRQARDVVDGAERGDRTVFYYSRDDANRTEMTAYLKTLMLIL